MKLKNKTVAAKKLKAAKKLNGKSASSKKATGPGSDDFSAELISQLNKEAGSQIAFNLGTGDAPTEIKRWISTGSRQLDCILSNRLNGGLPEGRIVEIQGPTSCHAKGAKVMLFDGTFKKVEHVKVGDKLMGPDSTPREVLKLVSGEDELYRVTQRRTGVSYVFNQHHELALKKSQTDDLVLIPIRDYVKRSNTWKKFHRWFHVPVTSFENAQENLSIDPYVLGCLLGDGSLATRRIELTTSDEEISSAFIEEIKRHKFSPRLHEKKNNKAYGVYYATSDHNFSGKSLDEKNDRDTIRMSLRSLGLLDKKSGNKFIPQTYKTSTMQNRLQLLAGLIDTDGHNNKNLNYDFVSKSRRLAEDTAFVARSVGLMVSETIKKVNSQTYHRLCITGDLNMVPSRLDRKKATAYPKNRHALRTGIVVEPEGYGEFFGFTVDKDNLYLSDDFSVIKNSGKSHIAFEVAKATQKLGGVVVYMDTENATNLDNLEQLGIDVHNRFVFVQTVCTEEIFAVAESAIMKARAMTQDVPVTIIWDSLAASSPKAELEGDYDQNSIGLQARVLGKGMRKIVNIIGNQNVLMLLINQQRKNIGVMFGDDTTTPGGMAVPYAASQRIRITSTGQSHIKNKAGDVVGIKVKAKTIKNKVAKPFRTVEFRILFGVGVVEDEELFDLFREYCSASKSGLVMPNGDVVNVEGVGAWKTFLVSDKEGVVLHELKFHKPDFKHKVLNDPQFGDYVDGLLEAALVQVPGQKTELDIDPESFTDIQAASMLVN